MPKVTHVKQRARVQGRPESVAFKPVLLNKTGSHIPSNWRGSRLRMSLGLEEAAPRWKYPLRKREELGLDPQNPRKKLAHVTPVLGSG